MSEQQTAAPVLVPESVEQAELAMLSLVKTEAELQQMTAKIEKKIADEFTKVASEMASLEQKKSDLIASLREFANRKRDDQAIFPVGEKTFKLLAGDVQINAGQPSIQYLDGYDEATVLVKVKDFAHVLKLPKLTRQPEVELDKDAVMQAYTQGTITASMLTQLGLKHDQKESILVKPLSLDKIRKASAKKSAKAKGSNGKQSAAATEDATASAS